MGMCVNKHKLQGLKGHNFNGHVVKTNPLLINIMRTNYFKSWKVMQVKPRRVSLTKHIRRGDDDIL